MLVESIFGNSFKSEVKSSGQKLFDQDKISLSGKSDTSILAYARTSPSFKVLFSALDISSMSFTASCTCPVAKKNRFCKHIWATLLSVEENYPDFLSEKKEIEMLEIAAQSKVQNSYQEAAKLRAADYAKAQYQKQKEYVKEKKRKLKEKDNEPAEVLYPPQVEEAFAFFSKNGFAMAAVPTKDIFVKAKRTLSRVFHPDKGGNHEEFVELNRHCEVLENFFE